MKNVNGDAMPRINPSVKVREIAERHILDISARFGLDPSNRYRLLRDQAAAPLPASPSQRDMFEAQPAAVAGNGPTSAGVAEPGELQSPIGLMEDLGTAPPGTRPN